MAFSLKIYSIWKLIVNKLFLSISIRRQTVE
jgi:hypothetical protein